MIGFKKDWTEDLYDLNTSRQEQQPMPDSPVSTKRLNVQDSFAYPQEVVITCPNKRGRVRASLSGNLNISGHSEWEEMFGGGIAAMSGGILGNANMLSQYLLGATIQQPWMNRKTYKNTKPFSFSLPLSFVAIEDAKEDVVRPVLALLSFLYPRKYSPAAEKETNVPEPSQADSGTARGDVSVTDYTNNLQGKGVTAYTAVKNSPLGNTKFVKEMSESSVTGSFLNLFEIWEVPGPALLSGADAASDAHKGDNVEILVGSLFNFGMCYLEDVTVDFASSYDKRGFPLAAKVTVKATCADTVVCSASGDFIMNRFTNSAEKLDGFLNAMTKTAGNLVENISNMFRTYVGFYQGTLEVKEVKR